MAQYLILGDTRLRFNIKQRMRITNEINDLLIYKNSDGTIIVDTIYNDEML